MAWSDLPIDLLRCISSHLSIVDLVRLSIVCTSWSFMLANYALLRFQCRPSPWLLLSNDVGEASQILTFTELTIKSEEVVVSFRRRFPSISGHTYERHCFGSKDGWLVTLDKIDLQPCLFNPITKAEISLPSLFTLIKPEYIRDGSIRISRNDVFLDITFDELCDMYFHKFIVSSNDSSRTVVVIYGLIKELALVRPEDLTWVPGPQISSYRPKDHERFEDVCYHEENQRFYAITNFSMVLAFDLNGQNVELICPNMHNPYYHTTKFIFMYYIAFLTSDILRIERVIDTTPYNQYDSRTMTINVFKLVPAFTTTTTTTSSSSSTSSYKKWIPLKELEEYSIFVGCNQTFSLHHTVASGIKPNCIYFADNLGKLLPSYVLCDIGLFDLYNDQMEYIFHPYPRTNWPPSIWFTASFS